MMKFATSFERYAPAIAFYHIGAFFISLSFGSVVLRDGTPVTPELYGPAVYAIPALAWVAIQIAGTLAAAGGAIVGGSQGAWVCASGATISALLFAAIAVMATKAGATGTPAVSGCAFVMAPLSVASVFVSIGHLRGRNGQ